METIVADRVDVVDSIERYWLETGVPRAAVSEMRAELEQHLSLARADGRSTRDVVGSVDALLELVPGLRRHACSRGRPGGFVERLRAHGIPTTVRDTRGSDIDGACGQLAAAS